jgi:hypothetical protein
VELPADPGRNAWPAAARPLPARPEEYRQAEELEAMIMAMAEAVAIFDARGQVTRANPAAEDLFGFDPLGVDRLELVEMLGVRSPDGSPSSPRRCSPSGRCSAKPSSPSASCWSTSLARSASRAFRPRRCWARSACWRS